MFKGALKNFKTSRKLKKGSFFKKKYRHWRTDDKPPEMKI